MKSETIFVTTLGVAGFLMPFGFLVFLNALAWAAGAYLDSGLAMFVSVVVGWIAAGIIAAFAAHTWGR